MKDPVLIGDCWIDKTEIAALLPQDGKLLLFLRGGDKPVIIPDTLSREEIEKIVRS